MGHLHLHHRYNTASRWLLACLLLLAALTALTPPPALAARGHVFGRTVGWGVRNGEEELQTCTAEQEPCKPGIPGSGKGQFKQPAGVAVSEASGDVYVVDKGNNRVERFSSAGDFLGQFDGSGSFEVEGKVEAGAKPPTGQFLEPETIAVDNSCVQLHLSEPACKAADPSNGDVYVQDAPSPGTQPGSHKVVDKFNASGEYIGQLAFPDLPGKPVQLTGVAVDRSGSLWVAQNVALKTAFAKFSDAVANEPGEPPSVEAQESSFLEPGLALDGNGNFYTATFFEVSIRSLIRKFGPTGKNLKIALDEENSSGVATELPSNDVYVDNVKTIARFDSKSPPSEVERFGSEGGTEHLAGGSGLAVDSASVEGQVYVADEVANDLVVFPLEPPGPPTVEGESLSEVTASSASLHAVVNPRGARSEYRFEYGPCATPSTCSSSPYAETVPQPEGTVGAPLDFEGREVSAHPQDLLPATTYHFRAVAHNEKSQPGTVSEGEEKVFTTQPSGGAFALPDGRAWEMVSPPQKHGTLIAPISEGVVQAAGAGAAMTYLARAPTEDEPQGYSNSVQVLSTRRPGGWGSQDIALPNEQATGAIVGSGPEYSFFAEDLSLGIAHSLGPFVPSISEEASELTPYVRTNYLGGNLDEACARSCYRPLVSAVNTREGAVFGKNGGPKLAGASPDGRHVVIESTVGLSEISGDEGGLYEWSEGRLTLVSVLANGQPASLASSPTLGFGQLARHAVSSDGDRVVWSDGGHLFMREVAAEKTLQLDQGLTGTPVFQTASTDAARVFFIENGELYAYDAAKQEAARLTNPLTPEASEVLGGIVGASEDGTYVYLTANGRLSEEAITGTCGGSSSAAGPECSLYQLHEAGGVWQVRLVATLAGADFGDWGGNFQSSVLPGLTARVSPDGRFLEFMSQQARGGYDNRDAHTAKRDQEVYEFDAAHPASSANPACVSCNPTGSRPVGVEYKQLGHGLAGGAAVWNAETWIAANVPAGTPYHAGAAFYQSRYLSDSGRLFFNSSDALSPQDVNGTGDVYQYEPPGVGSCTTASSTFSERSGGCVSLISAGTSREESAFLDASENGADVFFLTASKLAKADFDTALDVYDAHECTPGSPCIPEPSEPSPPCITEASCKAPPTPQPEIFGAPASATFSGLGNIAPSPPPAVPAKALTRAQRLAKALSVCHKRYRKAARRRRSCERQARKAYAKKPSRAKTTPATRIGA
jgi:DNA-binding beta-propeller fold protein YncE